MTTPTHTDGQETTTQTTQDIGELSFSDYERMRRGEPVVSQAQSAQAEKAEQKPAPESDPEETEAKEEDQDEESESNDEETEDQKDKPRKKGGFQRRIEKLVAQREEERRMREALEERLARLEKGAGDDKGQKQVDTKAAEGKPNPENFDTHAEYVEALTDWKLEQREKSARAEAEQARVMNEAREIGKAHSERIKSFMEKTPDFQEVLAEAEDVEFSPEVTKAILESEVGPQIVYELAKNPEEALRIAGLSPSAAARAIGRLEAKLELTASDAKKPEPKKLTNAPKPIAPVGGGKGAVAKSIADPDLSFADYERLRREQLKRKQG